MNREIDALIRKRLFNLFGEHSFGADLEERCGLHAVTRGDQDLYRNFFAAFSQPTSDMLGLPAGQRRSAAANAYHREPPRLEFTSEVAAVGCSASELWAEPGATGYCSTWSDEERSKSNTP